MRKSGKPEAIQAKKEVLNYPQKERREFPKRKKVELSGYEEQEGLGCSAREGGRERE